MAMDPSYASITKFQSNLLHLKPTIASPPSLNLNLPFSISKPCYTNTQIRRNIKVKVSPSSSSSSTELIIKQVRTTVAAVAFAAAVAAAGSMIAKFQSSTPRVEAQKVVAGEITCKEVKTPSGFLKESTQVIEGLKELLELRLKSGEYEESLIILNDLIWAQPDESEWKLLMARLLTQMGELKKAQCVFEEILAKNPLCFEALIDNALLMEHNGDGNGAVKRLEEARDLVSEECETEGLDIEDSRNGKLMFAQIHLFHKNMEEALRSYEDQNKENTDDFKPHFCKGVIFCLLDKNVASAEQFVKYSQLSSFLGTMLGWMNLPGTGDDANSN